MTQDRWTPEQRARLVAYAGPDFDQPRTSIVDKGVFDGWGVYELSREDFEWAIAEVFDAAPRGATIVWKQAERAHYDEGDTSAQLVIRYKETETPEQVEARIAGYEQVLADADAYQRREYERLKKKFG